MFFSKTREGSFVVWQHILFTLHMLAAITAASLIANNKSWVIPVELQFNIWRSANGTCNADSGGCSIMKLSTNLQRKFDTGWAVPFFSIISGTHHLYAATNDRYLQEVSDKSGVAAARHIDYALSAPLMFCLDGVLWLSPPSLQQMLYSVSFMFMIIVMGYASEVIWSLGRVLEAKVVFFAAFIPFCAIWSLSWIVFDMGMHPPKNISDIKHVPSFVNATTLVGSDPPNFVIAILGIIFGTYLLFPIVFYLRLRKPSPNGASLDIDEIITHEMRFGFLSFVSKIPLLAVYATAVSSRSNRITIGESSVSNTTGSYEPDNTEYALYFSAAICIVLGFAMLFDLR